MNKLVSIIIPTYNSERTLRTLLESIKNQDYDNIEIIVIDNNSKDSTVFIAKEFTKYVFNQGPERSAQRNRGAKEAQGTYFLVLDSDMKLTSRVVSVAVKILDENQNLHGLAIPEESFGVGFWAACKNLERRFYVGVPWMQAARFFRAKTFIEMGGYDEQNTGTEDYDLPQRMEEKYPKCISSIDEFILHDEGEINLLHSCQKKFYYAQKLGRYISRSANQQQFSKQSSVFRRYILFFSKPSLLLKRPFIGMGMLFMKTCEMGAGAVGFIMSKIKMKKSFRETIYK